MAGFGVQSLLAVPIVYQGHFAHYFQKKQAHIFIFRIFAALFGFYRIICIKIRLVFNAQNIIL
jgi:hypothetical protein